MRTVPTSGGIEWDSDGSAYLDAMPLPGTRRTSLRLAEVVEAVQWMVWQKWQPEMSPYAKLRGFTGILGINQSAGLVLRYIHKSGVNALDALYTIERMDELPPAIAGGVYGALSAMPLPEETTYVSGVPSIYARYTAGAAQADAAAKRLNRKEIDRCVTDYLRGIADNQPQPTPAGAINCARFWVDLSAALWRPDMLRLLGAVEDMSRLTSCNELAVLWLSAHPSTTFRIGKIEVRPPIIPHGSAWSEALTWTVNSIPAAAIRYFGGFRATDESWSVMGSTPEIDAQHAHAVAASLIREAETRRAYVAVGQFVLDLPDHLPWHTTPIRAFAIQAQADGLWVAGLTARGERTASWWWSPQMRDGFDLRQHTMQANPLAHVTLAAFWHDLVVGGDQVILNEATVRPAQSDNNQTRRDGARRGPEVTLPRRTSHIHLSGRRQWSSDADRELITRRSHGVRGHLRHLPEGWQRHDQVEDTALAWGFVVPDGYTFVQPHTRGGHDHDPQPVVARARGLQTLSLLI